MGWRPRQEAIGANLSLLRVVPKRVLYVNLAPSASIAEGDEKAAHSQGAALRVAWRCPYRLRSWDAITLGSGACAA